MQWSDLHLCRYEPSWSCGQSQCKLSHRLLLAQLINQIDSREDPFRVLFAKVAVIPLQRAGDSSAHKRGLLTFLSQSSTVATSILEFLVASNPSVKHFLTLSLDTLGLGEYAFVLRRGSAAGAGIILR